MGHFSMTLCLMFVITGLPTAALLGALRRDSTRARLNEWVAARAADMERRTNFASWTTGAYLAALTALYGRTRLRLIATSVVLTVLYTSAWLAIVAINIPRWDTPELRSESERLIAEADPWLAALDPKELEQAYNVREWVLGQQTEQEEARDREILSHVYGLRAAVGKRLTNHDHPALVSLAMLLDEDTYGISSGPMTIAGCIAGNIVIDVICAMVTLYMLRRFRASPGASPAITWAGIFVTGLLTWSLGAWAYWATLHGNPHFITAMWTSALGGCMGGWLFLWVACHLAVYAIKAQERDTRRRRMRFAVGATIVFFVLGIAIWLGMMRGAWPALNLRWTNDPVLLQLLPLLVAASATLPAAIGVGTWVIAWVLEFGWLSRWLVLWQYRLLVEEGGSKPIFAAWTLLTGLISTLLTVVSML